MDAGPDDVRSSAGLGPISPELVLVDPVLAERARKLLRDPRERPRSAGARIHEARPSAPVDAPSAITAEPRKPRWRRTVALAALVFGAGAVSGNFLGGRQVSSTAVPFDARTAAPTTTRTGKAARAPRQRVAAASRPAPRPPAVSTKAKLPPATSAQRQPRQAPRARWAANVLGVTAQVGSPGVKLAWQRPKDSGHVVVVRARGARRHGLVVFHGRATSYRDASPRRCTAYRYTIVNFDRSGHRSTGVPTSVVTQGCT